MKNPLVIILIFLLLVAIAYGLDSCEKESSTFTGYVVGKIYTPEHRCHDGTKGWEEASLGYVHVATRTVHHHHNVSAEWEIFVANRHEVKHYNVSEESYPTFRLGRKVTMND